MDGLLFHVAEVPFQVAAIPETRTVWPEAVPLARCRPRVALTI